MRSWPAGLAIGLACAALFAASPARSQDSNYWSSAYGTRAQLLGGVVIGSPGDISAVYYNPGALALAPNSEFLLSGQAVQFTRVSVKSGAGPRRDLATSTIATLPSLIAGELPILKTDRLAYSYLTRQSVELDMEKSLTIGAEADSPIPNATFAAFELGYHQSVNEYWYGLTWAHTLARNLGLGITPDLVLRSQHTTATLFAMGENAGGQQAVLQYRRDYDYMAWRLLAKLGLSGARDSLTYGVTVTTPGLELFGGGNYRQSENLTDQTGSLGNIIGASYQVGVPAHYHSPVGLGAGASYAWGAMRLHTSAEWWDKVDSYSVLDGQPMVIQTPSGDSTASAKVMLEMKSVFNFGFGLEDRFTHDVVGYVSYHTDRSGRSPDSPPDGLVTSWDLNHFAGGVTFNAWRSNFAVGVEVASGSRPIEGFGRRPDLVAPPEIQTSTLMVTGTLGWKIAF